MDINLEMKSLLIQYNNQIYFKNAGGWEERCQK